MNDYPNTKNVFKKGSTTYYMSSLFFPKVKRTEITLFYAWVRIADNYVDNIPQQKRKFTQFCAEFEKAWTEQSTDSFQIAFVALMRKYQIKKKWLDAFLHSMRMDLTTKVHTQQSLNTYIYGSAQVIGLILSRILELDPKLDSYAQDLGYAMQLINMIRDSKEDTQLGRQYLIEPIQMYIPVYKEKDKRARKVFSRIPYRYRVAIKTAADLYIWTAQKITQNPDIVLKYKVKPPKIYILYRGILNAITEKIS